MGDRATFGNDRAANAPDAAAFDKGKGKAVEPTHDMSMDEEEETEESDPEEMMDDDDEDDDHENLEPIDPENIISNGRRTRGKAIDYREAAAKLDAEEMDDDEDDDEEYEPDGNDDKMRD